MTRVFHFHPKSLLLIAVVLLGLNARSAAADVVAYTDQVLPPTTGVAVGQPLKPGDLTMQDILDASANAKRKVAPIQISKKSALLGQPAAAPVHSSDPATLMQQGMQGALGVTPTATTSANFAPSQPTTVAEGISALPLSDASPKAAKAMAGPCEPQTTNWTKSCADAGYPANYVGQIKGETRSTCPDGNLQDVWIANGCVPPDSAPTANAPLTTPASGGDSSFPFASSTTWRDGSCGPANGLAVSAKPANDLCVSGTATDVSGDGPWKWDCKVEGGGISVSCAAPVAAPVIAQAEAEKPKVEDAECGSASGIVADHAPAINLCAKGKESNVNGSGPWTWACSGINGGKAVSCGAQKKTEGVCGAANNLTVAKMPSTDLCASGYASAVTGSGPWAWTCSGLNGGDAATCSANPKVATVPVPAPIAETVPAAKPVAEPAPAPVVKSMPKLAAPAATVALDNAALCGSAAELIAIEAPTKNLCKSGTAGSVSGKGPWSWTCSNHGDKSSCATLSLAPPDASARPSSVAAVVPTPAPMPTPVPVVEDEAAVAAVAPVPVAPEPGASCGSANGNGSTQEPASDLCSEGKASSVMGKGPWTWTCMKGKTRANCNAYKITEGACGNANGSVQKSMPTKGLCTSGTASSVEGTGPWNWSCNGSGGGNSISCSAASQAQTRVDGICGAGASSNASAMPAANLCNSGVASSVYGKGPWTWTCSGMNGGNAATCTAQKYTPAAPPPPGPAVNGLCGTSNGVAMLVQPMDGLCVTGTASSISGDGPWNWNCLGENSGMNVSCTAPLQPPAPISGVCGAANGVPTITTPKSGLCSGGISSAVSGKGPWTWSCSGVNGGSAVGCVAPLAGGDVGSLPSMTTTADQAPVALAAPQTIAPKKLITPRLPSKSLPAIHESNSIPSAPTNVPVAPMPLMDAAPSQAPQLPSDTEGVTPPPIRDTIEPSPALRSDSNGNVLPGNHFVLPDDVSTIPFEHGSDNYDAAVLPQLTKLAELLLQNTGTRITLTAYADNAGTTPREARRLSLSRALTIRDFLTSKAISSARIDVRALGANVASGGADRVDIKAN